MAPLPPILLVGGGKMGSAMLAGWRETGLSQAVVVDPAPAARALLAGPSTTVVSQMDAVPVGFQPAAIVLAVKPQVARAATPGCARFLGGDGGAVVLSIMAGKTLATLAELLGSSGNAAEPPVVRAMPNTPAAIRQGITAAYAGPAVSPAQRELCDVLLRSVGEVAWLEREDQLDPVTAVSGGGPAYVFLLAELLASAAEEQGLPPDLAARLARQTVAGSGALLAASPEPPAALRTAVTSPAGTTERALAVLMDKAAWPDAISRAIAAATARSRELAG